MHVVARLVLHPYFRNIQTSWTKLGSAGAALVISAAGSDEQKSEWLPKLASGEIVATLAVDEGPHHAPGKSRLKVSGDKISGGKTYVADGHIADLFVVAGADAREHKH